MLIVHLTVAFFDWVRITFDFLRRVGTVFWSLLINGGFLETKKRLMKDIFDLLLRPNQAMRSKFIRLKK